MRKVDGAVTNGAAAPAEQPAEGQPEQVEPVDRVTELEAALEAAKAEAAQNWDKYLRERAEMENYRRRLERNQADQLKRARQELLLKTLGVLDNLERAVAYQADSAAAIDAKGLLMGLKMTYAQFKDLLASEGLAEVKAVGEQFDPALHEAVATEVAPDKPEGQIVAELQKGYTLGDELLRPARVRVATRQ
jgi:molecular chaperone GrpE